MHLLFAGLLFGAILTLWVNAVWPVTAFQVGIFALTTVTVLQHWRKVQLLAFPTLPCVVAVCLGAWQWVAHRTLDGYETRIAIVHWMTFAAVCVLCTSIFQNAVTVRWLRTTMVLFAFLVAIVAILQTFTAEGKVFWLWPSELTPQPLGPILSRNHYAAFAEAVLPIALYQCLRGKPWARFHALAAATLFASVIVSASRAGAALAVAEIIAVPLLMRSRRLVGPRAWPSLGAVLGLVLVFGTIVGWQTIWDRFLLLDPAHGRWEFVTSTLRMIGDHPWFGVGLGTWTLAYPRYATVDLGTFVNQAHCDWLQWTAEGGIPFGLLLLAFFLWGIRQGFRSIWGLGVAAVFLHAFVDYPFSRPALGSWLLTLLCLTVVWPKRPAEPASPVAAARSGVPSKPLPDVDFGLSGE
jgi:O-antigen ligase